MFCYRQKRWHPTYKTAICSINMRIVWNFPGQHNPRSLLPWAPATPHTVIVTEVIVVVVDVAFIIGTAARSPFVCNNDCTRLVDISRFGRLLVYSSLSSARAATTIAGRYNIPVLYTHAHQNTFTNFFTHIFMISPLIYYDMSCTHTQT